MDTVWQLEINLTLFLQNLGSWLNTPMEFFTFLGSEYAFLALMPLFYWSVDSATGLRIGLMLLISNGLNTPLKFLFHSPRPYWIDPNVVALSSETSFGMPSGHAQMAASIWGTLAASLKRRWLTILLIFMILMIGISRIYLGVHFTSDVLVGWAIGVLLLVVFLSLEKRVAAWFTRKNTEERIVYSIAISFVFILLPLLIRFFLQKWEMPAEWIANAIAAAPDHPPAPFNLGGTISIAGTLLGTLAGLVFQLKRNGMFDATGAPWQRILRYLVGMAGMLLIWSGLDLLFPGGESILALILRYVRYALTGFWMTGLAPLVFQVLKLSNPPTRKS
ncbi:MAG TPA: phosphatase PAP2 family protein [Anaerolineaceae bacterium]|nr:phosphatase PAP2 family protein [Anaerolineaceae bacterium]HQO97361.1 phosphatase PAP2 family protein [Anaerolineaceae bacterium]